MLVHQCPSFSLACHKVSGLYLVFLGMLLNPPDRGLAGLQRSACADRNISPSSSGRGVFVIETAFSGEPLIPECESCVAGSITRTVLRITGKLCCHFRSLCFLGCNRTHAPLLICICFSPERKCRQPTLWARPPVPVAVYAISTTRVGFTPLWWYWFTFSPFLIDFFGGDDIG